MVKHRLVQHRLPVPREAISVGEKLGQNQAAAGTSRQCE